jgi:hypothetical protein
VKKVKTVLVLLTAVLLSTALVSADDEGALQDNYDETPYDYGGYHNKMQDSSDQLEPGAETERNWNLTSVFGEGYVVYDTRDSTPGPDNWALTKYMNYSVGNRGNAYAPGYENRSGCYYQEGVSPRTSPTDDTVSKRQKVFGNSFANASHWDGDGKREGVWEDPDEVPAEFSNFTCDLTGPDKGYGFDTGNDGGDFHWKSNDNMTHTVIGDVAFPGEEGKNDSFAQEPPACGDDHKEFLVEELGETINSENKSGSWACSGRRDVCVARHGGEYAMYRQGDLVNTDEASEEFGRVKGDKEFCETEESEYGPYGVWYDQDYSEEYCQANDLYGELGIRWINSSYIDKHPNSVLEGIDDDLNPYLYKNGEASYTSTQGELPYSSSSETPVPTGKMTNRSVDQYYSNHSSWSPPGNYLNLTATQGFCGGDEEGENIIVQESSTSLVRTNYSVMAVASDADDCVLDGANYDDVNHNERRIYSSGEKETVNLGPSQRKISCYGGTWYDNWPVVFNRDNVTVEEGTRQEVSFQLINVQNSDTKYDVELRAETPIEPFTEFGQGGVTFTETLPPQTSRLYSVEVFGANASLPPQNIEVYAEAVSADINGSDEVEVSIVDRLNASEQGSGNVTGGEVPGMGPIHLIVLMLLAATLYYTRMFGAGMRQK